MKELRGTIPVLIEQSFRGFPRVQLALLFAFGVASRAAGLPRDSAPDAREWAGRASGFLLVAGWVYSGTIVR